MRIRQAGPSDVDTIVRLVNVAYEVEKFFVAGDRTTAAGVSSLTGSGTFLVGIDDGTETPCACVYVSVSGERGYFGMLAVAPDHRGRGFGHALIQAAEEHARAAGCRVMDIKVVNLRAELFAFYEQLGYREVGTEPYEHRPVLQPCHFVRLEKQL